jgi:AcrR family transcriptional regulator
MARPSLKAERQENIMAAFMRCIAKFGLEASSLDEIAKEADMPRSLVRHFSGNREDLVNQVADFVASEFELIWKQQEQQHSADTSDLWLVDVLFSSNPDDKYQVMLPAFYALLSAAHRYPKVSARMAQCFKLYITDLTLQLKLRHPLASTDDCQQVALGVISIYFAWDSFRCLTIDPLLIKNNKKLITRLLSTLS